MTDTNHLIQINVINIAGLCLTIFTRKMIFLHGAVYSTSIISLFYMFFFMTKNDNSQSPDNQKVKGK